MSARRGDECQLRARRADTIKTAPASVYSIVIIGDSPESLMIVNYQQNW